MIGKTALQWIREYTEADIRDVITCKPVKICKGAWVGAGSTILHGVTVGKWAIVGAASVVTKDILDYAGAVGNPARVMKYLDKEKFKE